MSPATGPRRLLILLAGALTLLVGPESTRCEPDDGSRCVLSGIVSGWSEDAEARVELRRLADLRWTRSLRWDRPCSEDADPRRYGQWLAAGRDVGTATASQTLTGGARAFTFEGLSPGLYGVRVLASGRPAATVVEAIWADGQRVEVDVALPTGTQTLRVRVRMPDGTPFRGTVVATQRERGLLAFPYLHGGLEVGTDETGLAVIDGLHPGSCELSALIPGALRVRRQPVTLPFDGTCPWTFDPGPGIRGRLVTGEDETPVSGATVYAYRNGYRDLHFALAHTASDEAGAFRLPVGGRGTEVLVVAEGCAPAWLEIDDETDLGRIGLAPTATVSGWVRKPDGAPLPGATIRAEPRWPLDAVRPALATRADATGRYTLTGVPPGEVKLFVRGDSWISPHVEEGWSGAYDPYAIELRPGERRRLDLEAVPAARVRGRVLDADGGAVPGALVRVWSDPPLHGATDASGHFEIGGLTAGEAYDLRVLVHRRVDARHDDVVAAIDPSPVEIRFETAFFVPVSVVKKGGTGPAVRACLRARQDTELEGEPWKRTWSVPVCWTDAQGRALVGPLKPGKARLNVSAPGFFAVESSLVGGPGPTKVIELEPMIADPADAEPQRAITGRVIPPPGIDLGPVSLRRSESGERLIGLWENGGGTRVPVHEDGSFVVLVSSPGRYGLRAEMSRGGEHYWAQVAVEAGATDIEIQLRPAPWTSKPPAEERTWKFRIIEYFEHDPVVRGVAVADVRVLERRGESRGEIKREYRGGRLEVVARPDHAEAEWLFRDAVDACGLWLPLGPARVGPVEPGGPPIQVVLPLEETITGFVTGPDGEGMRGVRVHARAACDSGGAFGFHDRTALTREDGRFRLGGLGSGDHVLRLDVPVRMARVEGHLVEAGRGRWSDLRIRVHEAVAARVLVRDLDGKPLPGVRLRIEPDEGDFWTFEDNVVIEGFYSGPGHVYESTSADGWAAFARLDPERSYVLWVEPPNGRDDLASIYLPAWGPRATQEICLTRPAIVRGVVQDETGAPVAGACVWARQPPDCFLRECARTAADGTFTIDTLRHGAVVLAVTDGVEPHDDAPGILRTNTDVGSVVLVLEP